ncbi:MAG: hypothetical protein WC794_03375 [Candidatus Doudnabacteria bacterium]
MNKKTLVPLYFGGISGLLSWIPVVLKWPYSDLFPGVVFALSILIFFSTALNYKISYIKQVIFLAVSIIAYEAAFRFVIYCFENNSFDSTLLIFFIAGVIGSLILSLGAKLLLGVFNFEQVSYLPILGGMLGWAFWLPGLLPGYWKYDQESNFNLLSLYLVWQTGMLIVMNKLINKNNVRI